MGDEFSYIRKYYGVDARRGQHVTAVGRSGVIIGADGQYLLILCSGDMHPGRYHPTYRIDYLPTGE